MSATSPRAAFPPGPVHWLLDWDGTLTKHDTLNALVGIATKRKPATPVLDEWTRVSEAYLADHQSALDAYVTHGQLPTTIPTERLLLEKLGQVEQKSVDRMSMSTIFQDLTRGDIEKGAARAVETGEVELRNGVEAFLAYAASRHQHQHHGLDSFSILSVNWSRCFIAACLRAALLDDKYHFLFSINSNELGGVEEERTTSGRICGKDNTNIVSSRDKMTHLELLRKSGLQSGNSSPIVYIGDSWTDFECLLAADLGICIRDDPMTSAQKKLVDSLERVGVRCVHIFHFRKGQTGVAWVRDFHEVKEWAKRFI